MILTEQVRISLNVIELVLMCQELCLLLLMMMTELVLTELILIELILIELGLMKWKWIGELVKFELIDLTILPGISTGVNRNGWNFPPLPEKVRLLPVRIVVK